VVGVGVRFDDVGQLQVEAAQVRQVAFDVMVDRVDEYGCAAGGIDQQVGERRVLLLRHRLVSRCTIVASDSTVRLS